MNKLTMSVPDLVLNAFVVLMSLWAVYNKWIAPRIQTYRKTRELQLLATMLNHQSKTIADPPKLLNSEFLSKAASEVASRTVSETVLEEEKEPEPTEDDVYGEESSGAGIEPEDDEPVQDEDEEPEQEDQEDLDIEEEENEDEEAPAASSSTEPIPVEKQTVSPVVSLKRNTFSQYLPKTQVDQIKSVWNNSISKLLMESTHVMVIGSTGAGKTITMQDMVRMLVEMNVSVVVCDPDAAEGDWPDTDGVYGAGDAFFDINAVLGGLRDMMLERRQQRAEGIRTFDSWWFVFDEYSDIQKECDLATIVMESALRRARKLNIHIMIGVQDTQVGTLGWERKSSLLDHTQIVKLQKRPNGSRRILLNDGSSIQVPVLVSDSTGVVAAVPVKSVFTPTNVTRSTFDDPHKPKEWQELESDDDEGGGDGWEPETEGLEGSTSRDGKEPLIVEMLRQHRTYNEIALELGTSTARVSRIKRRMGLIR